MVGLNEQKKLLNFFPYNDLFSCIELILNQNYFDDTSILNLNFLIINFGEKLDKCNTNKMKNYIEQIKQIVESNEMISNHNRTLLEELVELENNFWLSSNNSFNFKTKDNTSQLEKKSNTRQIKLNNNNKNKSNNGLDLECPICMETILNVCKLFFYSNIYINSFIFGIFYLVKSKKNSSSFNSMWTYHVFTL